MTKIPVKVRYYTEGYVIGDDWYDQKGSYDAVRIEADTYDELVEKVNKKFKEGSLDSGFGFQRLTGYELHVYAVSTVTLDGIEFSRTDLAYILSKGIEELEQ